MRKEKGDLFINEVVVHAATQFEVNLTPLDADEDFDFFIEKPRGLDPVECKSLDARSLDIPSNYLHTHSLGDAVARKRKVTTEEFHEELRNLKQDNHELTAANVFAGSVAGMCHHRWTHDNRNRQQQNNIPLFIFDFPITISYYKCKY